MTTIIYGRFPEWPKGTDCKSVVYDFGGSNPPPSTKAKRHSERNVFFALAEGRWRIRKPALRNVPVARFNRRGFRRNGSESTTGRVGTHVAVRPWASIANPGRHAPNPKERQVSTRPIRRKERSFDDEIYQHGPFVTIYCHLRRYPVGAHTPTAVGVQRATAVVGS